MKLGRLERNKRNIPLLIVALCLGSLLVACSSSNETSQELVPTATVPSTATPLSTSTAALTTTSSSTLDDAVSETTELTPLSKHGQGDDGDILWQTDHETGDFYEWSEGSGWQHWDANVGQVVEQGSGPQIFGRAIFNSNTPPGDCVTTISQDISRSGTHALKMALSGANQATQGCRVFRTWLDVQGADGTALPPEGYYSAWYFLPQEITTVDWWNIFQFKSKSERTGSEPMFSFNIDSDGQGNRSLYVYHKKGDTTCDCLGSCENVSYSEAVNSVNLPLQEWFHIEAFVKQSSHSGEAVNADGELGVWINGVQIIDQPNICTLLRADARLHWSVNNYTDHIIPSDVVLYVDDAVISSRRIGAGTQ